MLPSCHRKARSVKRVLAVVQDVPATWPRLLRAWPTLLAPPSVPRSITRAPSYSTARTPPPAVLA